MNKDIEVKKSYIDGLGVFALREFAVGERVVEWNQQELSPEEMLELTEEEKSKYLSFKDGKYFLSGEPMRYVNSSCSPNTKPQDNADVAIRKINTGDEITSNYSVDDKVCNCSGGKCVE